MCVSVWYTYTFSMLLYSTVYIVRCKECDKELRLGEKCRPPHKKRSKRYRIYDVRRWVRQHEKYVDIEILQFIGVPLSRAITSFFLFRIRAVCLRVFHALSMLERIFARSLSHLRRCVPCAFCVFPYTHSGMHTHTELFKPINPPF